MIEGRGSFTMVWGVDSNLTISSLRDADGDIFVDSGADDLAAISLIEAGNIGSAADKADP